MKKIKQKIIELFKNKKLWIFVSIVLIFFGTLVSMEYAGDSYVAFRSPIRNTVKSFLGSGRFITAIFSAIFGKLKVQDIQIYEISYFSAVLFLIMALYEMEKIINKYIKNNVLSCLISILIVLNTFIIELFMFAEKGLMIFSILMNVLAIKYIVKYFENKDVKEIIKSVIIMFLANGSYQGTVGFFVAVSLIFIIKNSKNIKGFLKNNLVVALTYGIPAFLDLMVAKLFDGSRVSGKFEYSETIRRILKGIGNMFETYTILPKNVFIIFLICIVSAIIYKIIVSKDSIKNKILKALSVIYIIIGTIIATVAPYLMQDTASIWIVARSTYTFASLCGIMLLYLFINFEFTNKLDHIIYKTLVLISIIYIGIQFISFNKIEISRYKLNALDKSITMKTVSMIDNYEKESGNKVSKVAIYSDKITNGTYKDIILIGDMNIKAYASDWAMQAIIKYFSGIELVEVDQDDMIANTFKQEDWNEFNEKQIIFKDDTMHLCQF